MPEISEHNLYDIHDLVATWQSGWKELAKLSDKLNISAITGTFGDKSCRPSRRIMHGIVEVFNHGLCESLKLLDGLSVKVSSGKHAVCGLGIKHGPDPFEHEKGSMED